MGVVDNFRDLLKVADAVNNLELYKKLSELQNSVYSLEEENRALKEELRRRDEQRDIGSRLHPKDNAYYLDDGKEPDGPFCLRCWDVDRKLVSEKRGATPGRYFCPECARGRR
jgi:hypothetical protein